MQALAGTEKNSNCPEIIQGKRVFIEFDGVYMNSDVWLNGVHLGNRPYGYSSFQYELTPYLKFGDEKNVLAVRARCAATVLALVFRRRYLPACAFDSDRPGSYCAMGNVCYHFGSI